MASISRHTDSAGHRTLPREMWAAIGSYADDETLYVLSRVSIDSARQSHRLIEKRQSLKRLMFKAPKTDRFLHDGLTDWTLTIEPTVIAPDGTETMLTQHELGKVAAVLFIETSNLLESIGPNNTDRAMEELKSRWFSIRANPEFVYEDSLERINTVNGESAGAIIADFYFRGDRLDSYEETSVTKPSYTQINAWGRSSGDPTDEATFHHKD